MATRRGGRGWLSSAVADHRKHELFNPCSALALRTRDGPREGGRVMVGVPMCMTMRGMALFRLVCLTGILILDQSLFTMLSREFLVELPELGLKLFERLALGFVLRVALNIPAPPVVVLPEDVLGGTHQGKYSRTFLMGKL